MLISILSVVDAIRSRSKTNAKDATGDQLENFWNQANIVATILALVDFHETQIFFSITLQIVCQVALYKAEKLKAKTAGELVVKSISDQSHWCSRNLSHRAQSVHHISAQAVPGQVHTIGFFLLRSHRSCDLVSGHVRIDIALPASQGWLPAASWLWSRKPNEMLHKSCGSPPGL